MNILITGGSGFIGTHLAQRLALEHAVTIYDRKPPSLPPVNAKVVPGDIQDPKALRKALKDIDVVLHLAATVSVPECESHPLEAYANNVTGTRLLLKECKKAAVQRILFTSSAAVYGNTFGPSAESDQRAPVNAYGQHKLIAEDLVLSMSTSALVARLFNVYGPGQLYPESEALLPRLAHCLQTKAQFKMYGDGQAIRDFVHVQDVVEILSRLIPMRSTGFYNIGTGYGRTIASIIQSHMPHQLCKLPARLEATKSLADPQKLWKLKLATRIRPEAGMAHYFATYPKPHAKL